MRFLVVDDEITARTLMVALLESLGDVTEAIDGSHALEKVTAAFESLTPFDVIFLDLSMPGIDGLELIDRLREVEQRYDQPYNSRMIVVSASRYPQDIMDAFKKQADGYLTKPVNISKLEKLLQDFSVIREKSA